MLNQEEINSVIRSYSDEITRLLEVKANLTLAIHTMRKSLLERDKEIERLKKDIVPINSNGTE